MDTGQNKKIIKVDKLILGGGASGIFFALELMKKGDNNFLILEKEDRPGGLCRSFRLGDLYYDVGAHALHKEAIDLSESFKRAIDVDNLFCQRRKAQIFIFNKLIPHPFQLHLFYAPLRTKIASLFSYIFRKRKEGKNLSDWLVASFGKKICEVFLFPYNRKMWKTDLAKISLNWVSRVPSGTARFLRGLFLRGDRNYSSNEFVCYPASGGYENLFSQVTQRLKEKFALNTEASEINLENKKVRTKNGDIYEYNRLISTLPIDILVKSLATPRREDNIFLADKLEKVSTCLITFLTAKLKTDLQRVYVSEEKYFAHRITLNSNSSPNQNGGGESVVSFEISFKDLKNLPSKEKIVKNCLDLIKDLRLIDSEKEIKKIAVDYFNYMYPTQTLDSAEIISKIQSDFKKYDCYSIGRFGSWNYANIDGIFNEAIDLARDLK